VSATRAEPTPRLFLDANVLVSGIAFRGPEAELLGLAEQRRCEAVTCEYVLVQVERVLIRRLGLTEASVREALSCLPVRVVPDPPPSLVTRASVPLRDPTDAPVLAGAWEAQADALVSGDKDLLVLSAEQADLPVLRTRAALDLLRGIADNA